MDPLWSQLDPLQGASFEWKESLTPFSSLTFALSAILAYFASILILKLFMKNRKEYELRYPLALHNMILTLWSFFMCAAVLYDISLLYSERGLKAVYCVQKDEERKGRIFYSLYVYYLSKFYELLDTIFRVLKKKEIIFLHWYHHSIVILLVWSWLQYDLIYTSIGMFANTLIHVFMYYYYCLQSLGKSVWFKKYITSGQIVQFVSSFLLSLPFLYYHFEEGCRGFDAFLFSVFCNGSFLILFIRFYKQTYNEGRKGAAKKKEN